MGKYAETLWYWNNICIVFSNIKSDNIFKKKPFEIFFGYFKVWKMLKTRPLIYFIVFFQHFIKIDNIWLAQNHTGVWFFSDQTYLQIRMDTHGYFDTDKEGNVTKIVNSKYFFFSIWQTWHFTCPTSISSGFLRF